MSTNILQQSAWQLPASLPEDLRAFERMVAQFKEGKISATQFQVFRVPQGVYEQREAGAYMLRVRLPAGVILPRQMRVLGQVAARFGNGVLHVTTRQDIQVHHVPLDDLYPALAALAQAQLSTKGGGGNTVRNITACADAGVCADQAFDVTGTVLGLTEFLLADPQSFQLPRKFKIAVSGCRKDCAGGSLNDVGLIAKTRDGVQGFAVYAAGGMGAHSRVGEHLEEFVRAAEVPLVVEAIKRVFNRHGNRKEKHLARLRFLVRQIGWDAFRKLYREELARMRTELPASANGQRRPQPAQSSSAPGQSSATTPTSATSRQWMANNVRAQAQTGYSVVEIPLALGDIAAETFRRLADVVEHHGEQLLRTTQAQNLALRWVRQDKLEEVHQQLARLGLGESVPPVLRNLVACAGASTCKLGICLSRGLAQAIADKLRRSPIDLASLGDLRIHISGCPNACGRHPVGQIGLQGAARRVDGRLVPHYVLQLGGHVEEGKTQLAAGHHAIPARNVPAVILELVSAYAKCGKRTDFDAFVREAGRDLVESLAAKYKTVPRFAEDKNFYYDWGADQPFSLAGRGPGECGAGVLDLIQVDLKSAAEALQEKRWFTAAALAARALLVTRGEQAGNDLEAFQLFQKHFVQPGLVEARIEPFIQQGMQAAAAAEPAVAFRASAEEATGFVNLVQELFKHMDATLQFPKPAAPAQPIMTPPANGEPKGVQAHLEKDFRGVVCPLNYVKTRMALDQLKPGQTLAVLLDAQGARNVPESAAKDGHEILSVVQEAEHWRVLIRKAARAGS